MLVTARQMIQLLQLVHSRGVAHRDVKPDNFLVNADFRAPGAPCAAPLGRLAENQAAPFFIRTAKLNFATTLEVLFVNSTELNRVKSMLSIATVAKIMVSISPRLWQGKQRG